MPEYPGYSFLVTQLQGHMVNYPLNEDDGWSIKVEQLEQEYKEAKEQGVDIKAMVVINPNNPTGAILSKEKMWEVCPPLNFRSSALPTSTT